MTVSEQIIQVLDALCDKFGVAVDWTSENVIPYLSTLCGKLVSYEIWTSVAWMAFVAVLCVASIIATKLLYPTFKKGWEENARRCTDIGWQIGGTFAIIGLVLLYGGSIAVFATQIMDIIKCVTFPELYIIEYVQNLISSAS